MTVERVMGGLVSGWCRGISFFDGGSRVISRSLFGHGLAGGDLDEKFFERGVFEADFAEGPAVLDDGPRDLLAHVVSLSGADGGGDVLAVGLAVAGEDVHLADAAHPRQDALHFL